MFGVSLFLDSALIERIWKYISGEGLRARLIRGGLGSAGVQTVHRLLGFALSILLARALGSAGYGVYAYAFAILSLLMVLAEAGVPTLLMREVAAAYGRDHWRLLRGALIRAGQFVLLASVSVALIGMVVLSVVAERLTDAQVLTTMYMLLILPFAALVRTLASAMRGLQHVVLGQSLDMLLRPLLVLCGVGAVFVLAPTAREPQNVMLIQVFATVVALVVGGYMLSRLMPGRSWVRPAEYRSRQWFKSALPFTLIGGAGVINNHADIIMLGWFGSASEVGVYRVAVQGAVLVAFGLQVANAVIAPYFTRLHVQGEIDKLQHLVTSSARVVLLAALPVALTLVFAGEEILTFVFGSEFGTAHLPLAILALAQLANAVFGSVGFLLSMTGHEHFVARALWQTALLNVFLNGILIPLYGIGGAAFASAMALLIWNILLFNRVSKVLGIDASAFGCKKRGLKK